MLLKQHYGVCALSPCSSRALNGGQCLLALYDRFMEGYWQWRFVYVWVDLQSGLCHHLFFLALHTWQPFLKLGGAGHCA